MPFISETQIANMALSHIGTHSIESLNEANSAEAKQCRLWYSFALKDMLEAYPWKFAGRRKVLETHAQAAPEDEWSFRYKLPADYVKARSLVNPVGEDADAVPFDLDVADDGTVTLLTSLEDAELRYTFEQTNTTVFSANFILALSYALAAHVAYPITGKPQLTAKMREFAAGYISVAAASDGNSTIQRKPREAEAIRARS